MESSESEPVPEVLPVVVPVTERLPSLDLIRGVAILGVLIANMRWFLGPSGEMFGQQPAPQSTSDSVVAWITLLFVDGRFITLLSMLFGAGLAIQSERADAVGRPFVGNYLRRMGWLFVIGLAHALLLWFGDILAAYALVGSVALLLRRFSQRGLILCIIGLLVWVVLVSTAFLLLAATTEAASPAVPENLLAVMPADPAQPLTLGDLDSEERIMAYVSPENQVRTYLHGSFAQMVALRAVFWLFFLAGVCFWIGWNILACFLLGIYLWRRGVFRAEPAAARRLVWLGLGASAPLLMAVVAWRIAAPGSVGPEILVLLAALPQALAYLGLLLCWSQSDWATGLQIRLQAVGRFYALTNYLMQSLLGGLIFYGYGLGLFNQLDRLTGLGIAAVIGVLQLYASPIWLRHFRLGPVEWLWRSLADWTWLPFRQQASGGDS